LVNGKIEVSGINPDKIEAAEKILRDALSKADIDCKIEVTSHNCPSE